MYNFRAVPSIYIPKPVRPLAAVGRSRSSHSREDLEALRSHNSLVTVAAIAAGATVANSAKQQQGDGGRTCLRLPMPLHALGGRLGSLFTGSARLLRSWLRLPAELRILPAPSGGYSAACDPAGVLIDCPEVL